MFNRVFEPATCGQALPPFILEAVWTLDDDLQRLISRPRDRFRTQAEADGDIYVPNVEPSGPVEYVFIAMEPSVGRWARSPQEARAKLEAGFRNFVADEVGGVVLLHHAIRHYLGTESYPDRFLQRGNADRACKARQD
jgi:hypothetical protein